jgi:hypothetical protein
MQMMGYVHDDGSYVRASIGRGLLLIEMVVNSA